MKRTAWALLGSVVLNVALIVYLAHAAVVCTALGSLTTNLQMCKPVSGETGWASAINNNWDILDAYFSGTTLFKIGGILDSAGAAWIGQQASASAVNGIVVRNNTTGNLPAILVGGASSDTNVGLKISTKGTGTVDMSNSYGVQPGQVIFANLGSPSNGVEVYCPDCTFANPCAGGGTGAMAKRLNGAWRCD